MKNSTLLFRSLLVIVIIAGGAQLVTYASQGVTTETTEEVYQPSDDSEHLSEDYNSDTDYIIGNWKVSYSSKDFKGAVVYTIKKEDKSFNAYTTSYEDASGNAIKAENAKVLTITSFDGYKGKGIYEVEYEEQKYQVECKIDMIDEDSFKLSYDYYGYSDVETWKRQ